MADGFRCTADFLFLSLLTSNFTTGQLKTALVRHFYALSDRRQQQVDLRC